MHDANRERTQGDPNVSDSQDDALGLEQVAGSISRRLDEKDAGAAHSAAPKGGADDLDSNDGTGGTGQDRALAGTDARPGMGRGRRE